MTDETADCCHKRKMLQLNYIKYVSFCWRIHVTKRRLSHKPLWRQNIMSLIRHPPPWLSNIYSKFKLLPTQNKPNPTRVFSPEHARRNHWKTFKFGLDFFILVFIEQYFDFRVAQKEDRKVLSVYAIPQNNLFNLSNLCVGCIDCIINDCPLSGWFLKLTFDAWR